MKNILISLLLALPLMSLVSACSDGKIAKQMDGTWQRSYTETDDDGEKIQTVEQLTFRYDKSKKEIDGGTFTEIGQATGDDWSVVYYITGTYEINLGDLCQHYDLSSLEVKVEESGFNAGTGVWEWDNFASSLYNDLIDEVKKAAYQEIRKSFKEQNDQDDEGRGFEDVKVNDKQLSFKASDVKERIVYYRVGSGSSSKEARNDDADEDADENGNNSFANKEQLKTAYLNVLKKEQGRVDHDGSGMYTCDYFLFDLTGDGFPELFTLTGTCEGDRRMTIYSYEDGLKTLERDEEGAAGYMGVYHGSNYLVLFRAHQGWASTSKMFYSGGKIKYQELFEEDLNQSGKEDYTYPTEPQVDYYEAIDTSAIDKI